MYGFILNMWVMKKVDEAKVRSYVPIFISQDEANMILATPQWENYETSGQRVSISLDGEQVAEMIYKDVKDLMERDNHNKKQF